MMQSKHPIRKLKVCYGYHNGSNRPHPLINLAGHYLKEYGFNVGDFVELTIEKGLITIKNSSDNTVKSKT